MQLGLLDIVDESLVVVRTTDVIIEVKQFTTIVHRILFVMDSSRLEEFNQQEVGHLLLVPGEVLSSNGNGLLEVHLALTFLHHDQAGVGGVLGEEIVYDEVQDILWPLILHERKCSYQVEGEGHVIDDSKVLEVGGRDTSLDLEVDGLFRGSLASEGHEPEHLLS